MSRRGLRIVLAAVAVVLVAVLGTWGNGWRSPGATGGGGAGAAASSGPAADGVPLVTGAGADAPDARGGPDGRAALRRWSVDGREVTVPFSPNAGVVRGQAGRVSFTGSVAWYRTSFRLARGGDYALRFESVQHAAYVYVDGRRVARHAGAYLPFEARLRLGPGLHRVAVRADWRHPERLKRTGWHRSWFNFGGIGREVTLRPLAASELDSPGVVTRLQDGGRTALVDVTVRVRNRAAARALQVEGTLGATPLRFAPVTLQHGGAAWVSARVAVRDPRLWAPGDPALQRLRLVVGGETGWTSEVGLRELRWDGGQLRVNGQPLRLHGASLQEDAPGRGDALRPSDMDAIVGRLRAIGANATRSQHPLSPALLERLDAAGILVWQGIGPVDAPGAWTSDTPKRLTRAVRRVRLNALQARAHPSVAVWNLVNEMAGNGHDGGQDAYISASARALHELDPGRPVALDLWGTHLPRVAGPVYADVDAIGATNYTGWYDDATASEPVVEQRIRAWLQTLRTLFPGKVLVVTEFGAEANDLNAPDDPGGVGFQARLLARHVQTYDSAPGLDGWLAWNLQDFALSPYFNGGSIRRQLPGLRLVPGINQKGLFTYDGRPKPAAAVLRRLSSGR